MANESAHRAAGAGGQAGPEVVAACGLSAVPALGASSLARIARCFGSLAQAVQQGPRAIVAQNTQLKLRREAVAYLSGEPDLVALGRWAVSAASKAGAEVVLPGDERYPRLLRALDPAPLLYLRGTLPPEARRVAVVGSRDAGEDGLSIARSLGEDLARAGVAVVSGGARGVDTAAHLGAASAGGASIAVLGCGIDVAYPPENAELFERLASGGGALVSELPPGAQPAAPNFPRRNRTIAGLADAVVVVRAATRSGALITARHARQVNRPTFALAGPSSDPGAQGSNELLRTGRAKPVQSAADVLEILGWPVPEVLFKTGRSNSVGQEAAGRRSRPANGQVPATPQDLLADEGALRLWRLLDERTPTHVDDLSLRARLSPGETLRKLAELELKGRCVQRPGKFFLRR